MKGNVVFVSIKTKILCPKVRKTFLCLLWAKTTVCIKKRLVFEIQISHIVLNSSDKYNCLESFSEP